MLYKLARTFSCSATDDPSPDVRICNRVAVNARAWLRVNSLATIISMDLRPLDRIMLHAHEIKRVLDGHGLYNARVIGWAGAGKDLPAPAEIQVDLPRVTDLTSGDFTRLGRKIGELVGIEVIVGAEYPGEARLLPGEKIRYL